MYSTLQLLQFQAILFLLYVYIYCLARSDVSS